MTTPSVLGLLDNSTTHLKPDFYLSQGTFFLSSALMVARQTSVCLYTSSKKSQNPVWTIFPTRHVTLEGEQCVFVRCSLFLLYIQLWCPLLRLAPLRTLASTLNSFKQATSIERDRLTCKNIIEKTNSVAIGPLEYCANAVLMSRGRPGKHNLV